MTRIAVLGASGQLGRELVLALGDSAIPYSRPTIPDFIYTAGILNFIDNDEPEVVINCIAENRVDLAQIYPEEALQVNAEAVGALAKGCKERKIPLIHFSTDYVFDGEHYANESDIPHPINHYGRSKYIGELLVHMYHPYATIIRTSALYTHGGSRGKGGSFVDRLFAQVNAGEPVIRVVNDQITCPTYARDLAKAVIENLDLFKNQGGIYHLTNAETCSWFEFAQEIFHIEDIKAALEPIPARSLTYVAPRPRYSVLANTFLPLMPTWKDAITRYLILENDHHPCMGPIK